MNRLRRTHVLILVISIFVMAVLAFYGANTPSRVVKGPIVTQRQYLPISHQAIDVVQANNDPALLLPDEDPLAFEEEANDPDAGVPEGEWFWRQRAYPLNTVPFDANRTALRRASRLVEARQNTWQAIGPAPIVESPIGVNFNVSGGVIRSTAAGRVRAIAIDPQNTNLMYIATTSGGVWKSADGGQSFVSLTDSRPEFAFGTLALDPKNSNIIYAGTGELVGFYGTGLLKSTDGGQNWTLLGQAEFGANPITGLIVHPTDSNIIYVSTSNRLNNNSTFWGQTNIMPGLFRSTDGGNTWARLDNGGPSGFSDLVMDNSNPQILYAGAGGADIYKTTDGQTFNKLNVNFGRQPFSRIELGIGSGPNGAKTLYAGIDGKKTQDGVLKAWGILFKSTDGGQSWQELTNAPNYCSDQCWYDNVILVDPRNANVAYIGGSLLTNDTGWYGMVHKTTNGGQTWVDITPATSVDQAMHADVHIFAFDPTNPDIMWAGNDGGLYRYAGGKWEARNSGFNTLKFVGVAVHPTKNEAFGGMQDNSHAYYDGSKWSGLSTGDGNKAEYDPFDPNIIYSGFQSSPAVSFLKFTGSNLQELRQSQTTLTEGIGNDQVEFYVPFEVDPTTPGVIYLGTTKVYRTANRGDNWAAISGDLDGNTIRAIGVSPTDPNTLYIGTTSGAIFVGKNQGGQWNWTNKTNPEMLPNRYLYDIAVGLTDSNTVYLAYNGFSTNSDVKGHVFKSTDGGTTWTRLDNGDFPDTPTMTILLNPEKPGQIFVGTDIGVFVSDNDGQSWAKYNQGLPVAPVYDLKYRKSDSSLWAATYGRSIFRVSTKTDAPTPTPLPNATATSTPTAMPTATSTATPANTPTLPPVGVVGGSWSGDKATFDTTTDQSVFNLRIKVTQPGCERWFLHQPLVAIQADGSFTVSGQERDYKWGINGKFNGYTAQGQATFENLDMGSSVCGGNFTGTIDWTTTWQAPVANPTATAIPTATPIVVATNTNGIYGRVTYKGVGVANITVMIQTCTATDCPFPDLQTAPKATTDAQGFYNILNVPAASGDTSHYVYYFNDDAGGNVINDLYVFTWHSAAITNYSAGASLKMADMDIGGMDLVTPEGVATGPFPITFSWKAYAQATGTVNYAWTMFNWDTSEIVCESQPAPQNTFVLTEAFYNQNCAAKVTATGNYGWYSWVILGTDFNNNMGYGDSYYAGDVKLSASAGKSFLPIINRNK